MAASLRRLNLTDVGRNLAESGQFRSDQARVWNEVAVLHDELGVQSATGAMKDAFDARQSDLDAYLRNFPAEERQKGMLAFIKGRAVGFDFISRERAYGVLHAKLVKSYAMEAVVAGLRDRRGTEGRRSERHGFFGWGRKGGEKAQGGEDRTAAEKAGWAGPDEGMAREFLKSAAGCDEQAYESVGEGWSYSYTGKDVVGSALAVDGTVVHAAFFRRSGGESERAGTMADFGSRRRFRGGRA
jgi:hypothetical protein